VWKAKVEKVTARVFLLPDTSSKNKYGRLPKRKMPSKIGGHFIGNKFH